MPYLGTVVILTGPFTASAAENLALSLQSREAPALIVGERSAGQLSDVIPWVLPNGVGISIGMEVYERPDGTSAEATGLSPDVTVAFQPWVTDDSTIQAPIDTARSLLS